MEMDKAKNCLVWFKKCRSDVVISTKVGLETFEKKINLNANEIENSVDNSLSRLKTEYVDVLHLHKVSATEIERNPSIICTLQGLINKGKIRYFAISLNSPSEARVPIISDNFPIVQTNLSLLDMRLLQEGLIQFADNNKLAIIARTPFNFGFLAKNYMKGTRFLCPDHRSLWPQQTIDHWIDGANIVYSALGLNELTDTRQRVGLAIQFCLAFRPVSSVLVGALNEREMAMNVAASSAPPMLKNQLELVFNAYKSWEQCRVDC